jgi:cobalamin biosynthesis Mg chelatase CobN
MTQRHDAIAFGSQSEGCPTRPPRDEPASRAQEVRGRAIWKDGSPMGFESIIIVVAIVLIVLFVLGYFGRGRRA